jgi:hypothetical protein
MKTDEIFIAHPQTDEQVSALKAFMLALKIKFEISNIETYDSEFVEKIEQSKEQEANGKTTRTTKNDLKELLGL